MELNSEFSTDQHHKGDGDDKNDKNDKSRKDSKGNKSDKSNKSDTASMDPNSLSPDKVTDKGKVFIKTYGCQMNVHDSERIGDALAQSGYSSTNAIEDADLVLINTCHIREKAAEKVYSNIGRVKKVKQKRAKNGKQTILGITGCVAQAEGAQILKRTKSVDFVAGPQTYHKLDDMIDAAKAGSRPVETGFDIEDKFAQLSAPTKQQVINRGVAAFLTLQEGCDKFCSFCVVPYTRGAEVSRSVEQILDEAKKLATAGVRELTLLGQNVNAWHGSLNGKHYRLGDLLYALAEIPELERLRYTTSHPVDMDQGLIDAHGAIDKLMPYLHLPIQAGSNTILKAMNRRHTVEQYVDIIERVRKARSDIAISGDFIVGFPGESDDDFNETLALIRKINYAQAFSFKYSERPGTPGAELDNQIDEQVKSERLAQLQELLSEQQLAFNLGLKGQPMTVLLEKKGRKPGQLIGRSPWLQAVVCQGEEHEIGTLKKVKIIKAGPASLTAERLDKN